MIIASFYNEKKFITYTVLTSFIIMNMAHTWASSPSVKTINLNEYPAHIKLNNVAEEKVNPEVFDEFDIKNFSIITPNEGFSLATPEEAESLDTNKITSQIEMTTPLSVAETLDSYQHSTPDQNENSDRAKKMIDNSIFYSKMAISLTVSTLASIAFANLAEKLGEKYNNNILASSLYYAGLTANIILYCWNQMNLTKNDFTFQHYDTTLKKIGINSAIFAKQIIIFVASAGLAWIGYTQYADTNTTMAYFVSICGLIAQILIYSKSTSNLIKGISHKLNVAKLPYAKHTWVQHLQAINDSISVSSPQEIEYYYKEIDQGKNTKHKEEVNKLIALFPPNIGKHLYIKELTGLLSGFALSGVLGGMYLFEVGKPIYKSLFSILLPQLSNTRITQLSLVGSSMLALGATPLQVYSTYNVFKLYTEILYKLYDGQYSDKNKKEYQIISHNPSQESEKLTVSTVTKYIDKGWKYAKEAFIIFFSLGIAATRVALCMEYVQNKQLTPILNVGVAFSFFSIYYWTMSSLIESFTKVGQKRNELSKIITDKINQVITENQLRKPKRTHETI